MNKKVIKFLVLIILLIFTKRVYASESFACLYENADDSTLYLIDFQGEYFGPNKLSVELHISGNTYHSGYYVNNSRLLESNNKIINIDTNNTDSYPYNGYVIVYYRSKGFDAIAYNNENVKESIINSIESEEKYYAYSVKLSKCVSFDPDYEYSLNNAYNKVKGTKLEGLFKEPSKEEVSLSDYENICYKDDGVKNAVKIIGTVVAIMKWVTPFMIILFGMIDFSKAVLSDDENAVKKATNSLIRRIVAGLIIFFIPTILLTILKAIDVADPLNGRNSFMACTKCILNVKDCK